jgi:integrase
LLVAPLRMRTLVNLDRDKHIIRSRAGRRSVVYLAIPGENVKNGIALHYILPPGVVELVDGYWERFRPRLVTQPGALLFPGRNGPMNRGCMSKQISATIYKMTGLRMHTHLFRHFANYLIMKKRPGELKTASDLLGHRSVKSLASYCAVDPLAASERFLEILSEYLAEDTRDAAD